MFPDGLSIYFQAIGIVNLWRRFMAEREARHIVSEDREPGDVTQKRALDNTARYIGNLVMMNQNLSAQVEVLTAQNKKLLAALAMREEAKGQGRQSSGGRPPGNPPTQPREPPVG